MGVVIAEWILLENIKYIRENFFEFESVGE